MTIRLSSASSTVFPFIMNTSTPMATPSSRLVWPPMLCLYIPWILLSTGYLMPIVVIVVLIVIPLPVCLDRESLLPVTSGVLDN